MTTEKSKNSGMQNDKATTSKLRCGLIMPISGIDGCPPEHWLEVNSIISDAIHSIEKPSFEVKLVSAADDIGVIQKRIVQNLYDSEIVICDVSCKNPNVMFELGMRLAFDKPTILIKDDKTDYIFDTGVIEHITYPRDLRFGRVVQFKEELKQKLLATYDKSKDPNNDSSFLKNFGRFTVAKIEETAVSKETFILDTMSEMQKDMRILSNSIRKDRNYSAHYTLNEGRIRELKRWNKDRFMEALKKWEEKSGKRFSADEVIGNVQFYSFIADEMNAMEFFDSRVEFEHEVNDFIRFIRN